METFDFPCYCYVWVRKILIIFEFRCFVFVFLQSGWLGATSWAVSMFSAPVIIAFCRRKSTRLAAVIGGLVLALGILFTSFATQFHQVALSYGKCKFIHLVCLLTYSAHKGDDDKSSFCYENRRTVLTSQSNLSGSYVTFFWKSNRFRNDHKSWMFSQQPEEK